MSSPPPFKRQNRSQTFADIHHSSFPRNLTSSMRLWKTRTSDNTTPSQSNLEAGLAFPHASEDIADAPLTSSAHESKTHRAQHIPDDECHVENTEIATDDQHTDTTHTAGRRMSVSKLFNKWSRVGKLDEQPTSSAAPALEDAQQTNEKQDQDDQQQSTTLNRTETTSQLPPKYTEEARHVVESFNIGNALQPIESRARVPPAASRSYNTDIDYVPAPDKYKPSIFGAILTSRLNDLHQETAQQQQQQQQQSQQRDHRAANAQPADYLDLARKHVPYKPKHLRSSSANPSSPASGTTTPTMKPKWYERPEHASSMANLLVQAGISSTSIAVPESSKTVPKFKIDSPPTRHSGMISTAVDMIHNAATNGRNKFMVKPPPEYDVVAEVADIIARRRYLVKLCGAFMQYGAPTHRIEAYLAASARALLIDAQFMYIPGAMMCTFIDSTIQSNSVELVRKVEGLDFGRLKDTFNVYKCVIHEKYTAEEGLAEIENIRKRPDPHSVWFRILVFGIASAIVGPFSFNSRPIDFPPIFALGCALGYMQLKVVPRSEQFSNVFEVFACVMAAFIARGLGSIHWSDGSSVFCFSAVAQSSIAMILPGFMVLNSALELQGRNIVAGSVRMVYAIIYVLFLGFGLLVGTTVFGLIKRDATSDVTCQVPDWFSPADGNWKLIYTRFIWAPMFACCVGLIYRAKWRQLPVMALIATCGHQANFWISTQLSSNLQVANAVGAFVIGCLANLYSRMFHGLAAAAMLPAIYCQVPGGLASSGSLVAGINSSNQILGNSSSVSIINNGTQGFVAAQDDPSSVYGGTIFNVGYGMVQVAIGISVGLYLSALVVYPFGKRNSGLFSF